jgi:hypothetical protein
LESSAFQNVTSTLTNTQSTNWARNGSSTYYNFGNVGIGTTAPVRKLHIDGGSITSDTPTLRISSTDGSGTNKFGIEFYSNNGADVRGKLLADNSGKVYLDDAGGGGVIIAGNGGSNVGIGTTSPGSKLDIDRDGRTGSHATSQSLYVTGTMGTGTTGGQAGNIEFRHSNGSQGVGFGFQTIYQTGSNPNEVLNILSRGTGALTLNAYAYSSGNVLIGTTTDAGYKLDVNGTTRVQGNLVTTSRQYVQSTPVNIKLPWSSLSINGTAVSDAQASDGTAGVRYSASGNNTFFYGPYQAIDAGSYVARFRIKVASNASASYIGYIDVVGTNISGEAVSLRPNMLPTGGDYYYIDVPFNCNNDSSVFETRWIGWVTGITDTYIDHVLIVPQSRTNNVYVTDGDDYTVYESQLPRLTIKNATGNVGIGTTAPTAPLMFGKSTYGAPNSEDFFRIKFEDFGGIHNDVGIGQFASATLGLNVCAGGYIAFNEGTNGERVRIAAGGNVGIGTTSPSYKLQVAGNAAFGTNSGGLRIDSFDGDTGVISPTVANGSILITDDSRLQSRGTEFLNGGGVIMKSLATFPPLDVQVDTTRALYIDGTGRVGINNAAPSERLHVDGNVIVTYNNSFQGINSIGNKAILARVSPTTGIINYAEYATATNLNGFVMGSDDARVKGNIATDSLEFITNTSTRMTILSNGDVGINNTGPSYKLDVTGDARIFSGSLGVNVAPNATDGRIDASNDIVAYSTSDQRLKENVTPIENALEKVKTLTGVEFDWKEETAHVHGYHGHDVGVIAQDVQAVLPEAVRTNESGYLSVRYEKMIALLIEANKELAARVEELEKKLK